MSVSDALIGSFLSDGILRGIEMERRHLGDFVDFLSVDVQDRHDGTYLLRLYFNCELHRWIPDDLFDFGFDPAQVGLEMAKHLARSIRKVLLAANTGFSVPFLPGIETRLDTSVPEGVILMHPKTFHDLMLRYEEVRR